MTFWIFDFRFSIESQEKKPINTFPSNSVSDNPKSRIKNRKWLGLSVLAFVLLVIGAMAEAQQPNKVPRVGYLSIGDPTTEFPRAEGVRVALRELGYVEGQNIATEYRYAYGKLDQQPELAAELVRLKVDVILVSGGDVGIRAAMNATKTIPIVMMGQGLDPVRAGLIESLAHPGGNVTGVTNFGRELGGKRLELLKEAALRVAHVAVLYDPAIPGTTREVKEDLPAAARALGVIVKSWEVRDADGFQTVFAGLSKDRPDGLYVPGGGRVVIGNRKRIADFALKSRLPSMYNSREFVDVGGLMSYGADLTDTYRRISVYVDKILKGIKPADLPIERPTTFEFVVNQKTAKQIGLTIPPSVLARADRVIR